VDYSRNPDTNDDGVKYKYLLGCVDVFSRFLYAIPLEDKSTPTMIKAFTALFKVYKCKFLQTDQESAIMSKAFKKFLKEQNVKNYLCLSNYHCPFIENIWRTLKIKVERYFYKNLTTRWLVPVAKFVVAHNRTRHSALGETPRDVKNDPAAANRALFRQFTYPDAPDNRKPLRIGAHVRISTNKRVFDKESAKNWTVELFKITRVIKSPDQPLMYRVEDLGGEEVTGSLYHAELQVVNFPRDGEFDFEKIVDRRTFRRQKQVLVRWWGYGSKFDTWIPAAALNKIATRS